jgi:putative ABC transport system permease protein
LIIAVSVRALFRRRTRTLLALGGIAVSAALLLDMTMMASGLTRSFGELIGARGYSLRVAPRGTLPFDSEAGIREAGRVTRAIEEVPGVRAAAPMLGAQLYRVEADTITEPLFTTGLLAESQFLYEILEGTDAGPGEVVVSGPLAEGFGVGVGDTLRLAAELDLSLGRPRETRVYRVSGIADFLYDYAGQRSIAMPLDEVQALTRRQDQVSLFGVAIEEGVSDDSVAAAIQRAVPEVSVYSTREMLVEMDRRLLYFRQLAGILGTVALLVTALLVSTIITIGVRERFGEIATLRAIGVRRRRLLAGIMAEGLVLAAIGCLLGLPLGVWVAQYLDRILLSFPGIPATVSFFVWDAPRVALALGLVVAVGAVAGLVPGWGAVRTPLSQVLREEAE